MFVLYLLVTCVIHANAYENNGVRNVKEYILDTGLHKTSVERRIFNFKKNGIKIDVKVVPSSKDDSMKNKNDDDFPKFPLKDIGKCIIEFSVSCMKKRFVRFLETVGRLDEITLLGQDMKLVKSRAARRFDSRSMNNTDFSIERSINDFFDSFTLRITLPRWNTKREKNQIEVMLDEIPVAEGRGKKGGGGGGGGKGGGKCKMMMMGMLMMVKMKLMGLAAMKGMMMGGMSLMLSMMMLMQKLGKGGGGGPWQGGGGGGGGPWQGGGGGGGGQLKEIVLLTKSSGGGGGGGGCCNGGGGGGGGPSDSYGAPPPSSYGAPSGGGGGYGGGGGWGRSFHKRPIMLSHDKVIKAETADGSNHTLMIGEAISNAESIDYPDYQDYQEPSITNSSFTASNLNATDYTNEYGGTNISADSVNNNSKVESTVSAKGRSFNFNGNLPTNIVNNIEKNIDLMTSTNQPDITHDTNVAYMDEWQATAEKTSSDNVRSSISNARIEQQAESRRDEREIPLLRGI